MYTLLACRVYAGARPQHIHGTITDYTENLPGKHLKWPFAASLKSHYICQRLPLVVIVCGSLMLTFQEKLNDSFGKKCLFVFSLVSTIISADSCQISEGQSATNFFITCRLKCSLLELQRTDNTQ